MTPYELKSVITEDEFRANGARVMRRARNGYVTKILSDDGKTVQSIIGMSDRKMFVDPGDET